MIKESSYKYSPILIVLFIILFALLAIQDQFAIDTSSNKQSAILAAGYDAYELKINEEMGIDTKPISGEDIYNGRCIACHRFDVKVVGPPYNQTLPKYEGKKDDLVAFILNPVKKNPDYPAMPNQGLKPKEAEAIADYLLNTYKKNTN
jgi:cytochrome c551/c552